MTVPPVNSIDRCRPLKIRKPTAIRNVSTEIAFRISEYRMNGIVRWMRKNSMVSGSLTGESRCPVYFVATAAFGFHTAPMLTSASFLREP